jgi:hypothetical protein
VTERAWRFGGHRIVAGPGPFGEFGANQVLRAVPGFPHQSGGGTGPLGRESGDSGDEPGEHLGFDVDRLARAGALQRGRGAP